MAGSSEVLCSICFEEASQCGERTVVTLKCSHKFHLDCIGSYFNYKGFMQCPNCRAIENGEWQQLEHHNHVNDAVNDPNLEHTMENQQENAEGWAINELLRQQPSAEYDVVNYSINFEAGPPMAQSPHYGHHDIAHFHQIDIYPGIPPFMIGPTSGNHSSMHLSTTSFGNNFVSSDGSDYQNSITDHPLTIVNYYPLTMRNEAIDLSNAPQEEMSTATGMSSNANVFTPYSNLPHLDTEVRLQVDSRPQTHQGNTATEIITISYDNNDDNNDRNCNNDNNSNGDDSSDQ